MAGTLTWGGFESTPNGARLFNHGADECVALANEYNEGVLGGQFVQVGSARSWWLNYHLMPALYETFRQTQTPAAGAVVVWKAAASNGWHGHIGVVLAVNGDGSFLTLEQNAGSGTQRWAWRYTRSMDDTLLGFLVPHNNPAGTSPATDSQEDDMKGIIYRAEKYNAPYGVYAGPTGGFVVLANAEERDNLAKIGTPETWLTAKTLDELINDARKSRG